MSTDKGVTYISGDSVMPLNKMRRAVMQAQADRAMRELHHAIEEALEHQIKALDIDIESPTFLLKDKTGKYSARFKRVVYAMSDEIAEEYYFDDKLLVRVKKDTIHSATGEEQMKFTIEVPKYGDSIEPG